MHFTNSIGSVENKEFVTLLFDSTKSTLTTIDNDTFAGIFPNTSQVIGFYNTEPYTAVFLLEGRIRIRADTAHSNVVIQVTKLGDDFEGDDEVLSIDITAQVYAGYNAYGDVWQTFKGEWSTSGIRDYDAWQYQAVHFVADDTTFDLFDVGLHVQIQQPCSPEAYACAPCDNATLPVNAHFVAYDVATENQVETLEQSHCKWMCNSDYERTNGTCLFCPAKACSIGEYMKDCNDCEPCESVDPNIKWLSNGDKGEPNSCVFECDTDFFQQSDVDGCQECSLNLTCPSDFFLEECNPLRDAQCQSCTLCSKGTSTVKVCNDTTDTQCAECEVNGSSSHSLPEYAIWVNAKWSYTDDNYYDLDECYWECAGGSFYDSSEKKCRFCETTCEIGEYHTECTIENKFRNCMPCEIPENAVSTSVGRNLPTSCAWECRDNTSLVIVDSELFACEAMSTPSPPVVVIECDMSRLDCAVGEVFSTSSCLCLPCQSWLKPGLLAAFIKRDSCDWVCVYPFTRVNGQCDHVTTASNSLSNSLPVSNHTNPIFEAQTGFIALTILPFFIIFGVASCSLLR
jgi:hypothetical protein